MSKLVSFFFGLGLGSILIMLLPELVTHRGFVLFTMISSCGIALPSPGGDDE